ncbi:hypothetical protein EV426DRAFT_580000 [Tirmania nivea]|nr:hypothetical protein EV426DRAFT_580000 [Tirmania nivea]
MADIEKKPPTPVPDAGLRNLDHYKSRLPKYRYILRQKFLPLVRWETPYLAWFQEHVRTPGLDTYFAMTANLGTHTFFMVMLPIMFWFGFTSLGRAMVHILAAGVFFSGFVKDLLCLPRPLSPPLHRITMSGSAALEYGFPSTHSTNAVSVGLYGLLALRADSSIDPTFRLSMQLLAWIYMISIVLGRLYCGMHGFFDVTIGSALGALLAWIQWAFRAQIDTFIYSGDWKVPLMVVATILVLVRIHPEPADPCPCFDDGVAFAGVIIGVNVGHWHFAHSRFSLHTPSPATVPYSFVELGLGKSIARVLLGVIIIFAWREVMKPTLHSLLPPVFRWIEQIGLSLPRRDYKKASEYTKVPALADDTLPRLQELPALINNISRRTRSDSVGPQSAADAYETLAYREKRRRESMDSTVANRPTLNTGGNKYEREMGMGGVETVEGKVAGMMQGVEMSEGKFPGEEGQGEAQERREEAEMFMRIERPRVRYDVEVITKLFVYSGIAWLAVEGNPVLFEIMGLGMGVR